LEKLFEASGRYIQKVSGKLHRMLLKTVRGSELTPAEAATLQFIAAADHPLCQRDIEKEYGMRPASATQMLQSMEAKGAIRRAVDPDDHRRKVIIISDEWAEQTKEMYKDMVLIEEQLVKGLTDEEISRFREIMIKMLNNLSE